MKEGAIPQEIENTLIKEVCVMLEAEARGEHEFNEGERTRIREFLQKLAQIPALQRGAGKRSQKAKPNTRRVNSRPPVTTPGGLFGF